MSDIFKHELLNKQQSMNKQQRLALCMSVKHSSIVRDLLTCHNNLSENHNRGQRSCCCCCGRTKEQKACVEKYEDLLVSLHSFFSLTTSSFSFSAKSKVTYALIKNSDGGISGFLFRFAADTYLYMSPAERLVLFDLCGLGSPARLMSARQLHYTLMHKPIERTNNLKPML